MRLSLKLPVVVCEFTGNCLPTFSSPPPGWKAWLFELNKFLFFIYTRSFECKYTYKFIFFKYIFISQDAVIHTVNNLNAIYLYYNVLYYTVLYESSLYLYCCINIYKFKLLTLIFSYLFIFLLIFKILQFLLNEPEA